MDATAAKLDASELLPQELVYLIKHWKKLYLLRNFMKHKRLVKKDTDWDDQVSGRVTPECLWRKKLQKENDKFSVNMLRNWIVFLLVERVYTINRAGEMHSR